MSKKILTTPIQNEELESLAIGDIIYLNGYLVSSRDDVHQRLIKQHKQLPVDLAGKAIFHAGPIMQEIAGQPGRYRVISIGPTTSMRMEKYEKEFIAQTGLKLMVGKGGMGQDTAAGCREYKAIHAVFPGGCAVLAANSVEEVEAVEWLDLGMPEAMWVMRVKEFGPLIVSIDTRGNNLFENNKKAFNLKKEAIVEEICRHVDYLE
ncbi:MAG: L(+)-tartrate dehydratase subunit beta [Syntrophomonas sp.]|uniref:L(+)-tartrate dehydratase subunit beta n=1 Tax=Syntrophomonas sp. TaxID=2053627 RepID=UPI002614872F|nr:L(+)-tartrate dehydratase subunit beta [Syntrophomonas sp.]MDD2510948.1 L(+)-tartrate dehydratase subunit beta [Syntrophomonas sp.]MDD3879212.1 L(+)-tartrate dehydratase subunit beta [Syntrophomonas sp.]MDD4626992.1 L(+)-tartrate dehydratase subunit beta [Syntrophomonas sp.]